MNTIGIISLILVALMATATAQDAIINTSTLPDSVLGLNKAHFLELISFFVVTAFLLLFTVSSSGVGAIVAALAVGFFVAAGWIVMNPVMLLMVYIIAILAKLGEGRQVS